MQNQTRGDGEIWREIPLLVKKIFFNHGLRLKALFPPSFLWNLIWDTPELKLSCKFLFFCLICLFYFNWFSSSRIFYSFYIPLICVFLLPSMSFIPLLNVFNISFTALYNSYILKAVIKIKIPLPWPALTFSPNAIKVYSRSSAYCKLTQYNSIRLCRRLPDKPNRGGSDFWEQDANWRAWYCHSKWKIIRQEYHT